jgi:hypothetical protein
MKLAMTIAAAVLFGPVIVDALSVLGRVRLPVDRGGAAAGGVVIFVESIRWLGIRWGLRSVTAGFRRAGFGGEVLYWRWHATWRGWLVLPAIMDASRLEQEARRLAELIVARRRERPDAPIHLVGYSCGGYIAVRALELLPSDVTVDAAALLAPAMDPRRDLAAARSRLAGPLVVVSSLLDWFIVGLGTLAFGTGDRKHTPSAGMVGLRGAGREGTRDGGCGDAAGRVVEIRWGPGLVRFGHLGGHFGAPTAGFVRRCVAPAMGVGGGSREAASGRRRGRDGSE